MSAHPQPLTPKRLAALAAGLLILTGLSIWRLGQAPETVPDIAVISGETMGTTYTVKAVLPEDGDITPEMIRDVIEAVLARVNQGMSTYIEDSEISRFNRAEADTPFAFGEETYGRFVSALRVSEETEGAFDITVGPIVDAYGFGPETVLNAPSDAELDALRERVGYGLLTLHSQSHSVRKARAGIACNLSAIAKGYGVDALSEELRRSNVDSYFIDIGGEVYAAGVKPNGEFWRVGVERPDTITRKVQRIVSLRDLSMATSGDYRNYYEENGRRISHIVDPRTGRTIEHTLASVSVIHDRCEMADAYATALMVLGPDDGMAFAEKHGLATMFLLRTPDGGFKELANKEFGQFMDFPAPKEEG